MDLNRYIRTDKNEPRLIDMVKIIYFLFVLLYTVDDFKQNTPTYLRLMGLIVHGFTFLMLAHDAIKLRHLGNWRKFMLRLLPFLLLLTYLLSYFDGLSQNLDQRGLPIFILVSTPIVLYFFLIGYNFRFLNFLVDRRKIYNNGYLIIFVAIQIWSNLTALK